MPAESKYFSEKIEAATKSFPKEDTVDLAESLAITYYLELMRKHIDLVHRRIIKGETIPTRRKCFRYLKNIPN